MSILFETARGSKPLKQTQSSKVGRKMGAEGRATVQVTERKISRYGYYLSQSSAARAATQGLRTILRKTRYDGIF
jgi:hypothetical protein